jgi:hypothetical protein
MKFTTVAIVAVGATGALAVDTPDIDFYFAREVFKTPGKS